MINMSMYEQTIILAAIACVGEAASKITQNTVSAENHFRTEYARLLGRVPPPRCSSSESGYHHPLLYVSLMSETTNKSTNNNDIGDDDDDDDDNTNNAVQMRCAEHND